MSNIKDLTGTKVGKLTLVEEKERMIVLIIIVNVNVNVALRNG